MLAPGALARSLIASDARWLRDAILASQKLGGEAASAVPLALLGTTARVVYEGMHVVRTGQLDSDVSTLLQHAPTNIDPLVARARHATKLLDDSKRSVHDLVALLEEYWFAQQRVFRGTAPRALHWLAPDLGLLTTDGHVLAATAPLQLRLGLGVDADLNESGTFMRDVTTDMGSALSVLAAVDLELDAYGAPPPELTLPAFAWRDVDADLYLRDRFDSSASPGVKLALLMIEGELEVSTRLLPSTKLGPSAAVSRARLISLIHSVRGLRTLLDGKWVESETDRGRRVRDLVHSPHVAQFATDRGIRALRNQYVHYMPRGDIEDLDSSLSDYGLTKSLTGTTPEQLDSEVSGALAELTAAVSDWGVR